MREKEYSGRWKVTALGDIWWHRGFRRVGLLALARRLGSGHAKKSTATQSGAAPDRPQSPRFPAFRLDSQLVVAGGRRVSLALCCCACCDALKQAVLWPLESGCVKLKFGGVGVFGGRGLVALARRLGFGCERNNTATQQGAAPDRLQLRLSLVPRFSLRFRRRVSLVVVLRRAAWNHLI